MQRCNLMELSLVCMAAMDIQYGIISPDSLVSSDWEWLLDMTHKSFAEHAQDGLTMLSCSCSLELLQRRLSGNKLIVAECDGKIVGYYCVSIIKNAGQRVLKCVTMAVHPDYKRRGIGKSLHARALELGRQNECAYAILDTSCRAARTRAAHRAAGYRDWYYTHYSNANYYSIIMRKDLKEHLSPCSRFKSLVISWLKLHLKMNEKGELRFPYRAARGFASLLFQPNNNLPIAKQKNLRRLTLRETQRINFHLLQVFSDFCDKHGLRYLLCYGTLIGAVRHNGFIPWDDDVDVTMPVPDYYKFRELFEKENTNPQYGILYGMKSNVGIPYTMLGDMRTLAKMPGRDLSHARPVAIDIMPCYALSDEDAEAQAQISDIAALAKRSHRYLNFRNLSIKGRVVNRFCPCMVNKRLADLLSRIEEITTRYAWGSTRRVRAMAFVHTAFTCMSPDDFDHYIQQTFEEGAFRIPQNYHEQLSAMYGNYMELPPPDKRIANYSESYIVEKQC